MINIENLTKKTLYIKYGIYFIIILILILIIGYISNKIKLNDKNCKRLDELYNEFPPLNNLSANKENDNYKLRDYYIKTAYNCCAGGEFQNDYVNICALKKCIQQGYRCLDFEIYNINNSPVIAVSPNNNFYTKGSYNFIHFEDVIKTINSNAFSSGLSPNANDPLILHFRIKSNNKKIYDDMYDVLNKTLKQKLLNSNYYFENNYSNLGDIKISNFYNKAIILIDASNKTYKETKLHKITNIATNSIFMRASRNYDIVYTHNFKELIEYNKKYMSLSMPDLSNKNTNITPSIHMKYGVQFIAMCNQNNDEQLKFYNNVFNSNNCAFILKPVELRFIPTTIKQPKKQDPRLSYAPKTMSSDYYNFTV